MWLEEGQLNSATSAPNVAVYRSFCVCMLGAKFASENVRTTILRLLSLYLDQEPMLWLNSGNYTISGLFIREFIIDNNILCIGSGILYDFDLFGSHASQATSLITRNKIRK